MLKTIYTSQEQFDNYDAIDNADHENVFYVITDLNGNKYLIAHGKHGLIWTDHGLWYSAKEAYNRCIYKGFIEEGEHLNILCCYGGEIENADSNITIINTEKQALWINRNKNPKTGIGRLVCFTKSNLIDHVKARIAIWA